MKSLFCENRMANILILLRRSNGMTVSMLASTLNVSERSIRNDIKQINEDMSDCAVIDMQQKKCVLRVYQELKFRKKFSNLIQDDDVLNSPRHRMDYIFGRLMRADEPVLTDELAYEMNVGRTTMISDLKELRYELEPYEVDIVGKTSKGLSMIGQELGIRRYVLENNYEHIYKDYPLDEEIIDLLDQSMEEYSIERSVRQLFVEFVTLMLDRFLTGHYIGKLTDQYYNLTARKEYEIVNDIMNRFEQYLHIEIPVEERIYTFLPIVGMRTPADIKNMELIMLDERIRPLMDNIISEINAKMNITIHSGDLTEEFLYHMMFMINRLRFGVKVENPHLQNLKNKYPLAYQMAVIASEVIEDTYDVIVSLEEKGFLAFYFEVFLSKRNEEKEKPFSIAVICGSGRVSRKLISLQLNKIIDSTSEVTLFSEEQVTRDILNSFDLILTTVPLDLPFNKPMIRINEIFDEQELLRKIEKMRYWNDVDIPMMDDNWFVAPGLLDESRFFYLDKAKSYEEAVSTMVSCLVEDGQLDEGFADRLAEREAKGTMVFDKSIAIPHCMQYEDERIVLAFGVLPKPVYHNHQEVQIIFLMGIPKKENGDDEFLIRVYDELMSITSDEDLKGDLIRVRTFSELMRALYRRS